MAEPSRLNLRNIAHRGGQSDGPGGRGPRGGASGGQAAVPWYVGQTFSDAPPGHRYLLYLPFWNKDWSAVKSGKQKVLKDLSVVPEHAKKIMVKAANRQRALGLSIGAEVIDAVSASPFATGLGWEHPNENGFAFLQPYGLPYLAGSGVKGILRRAAEELALFVDEGSDVKKGSWTLLDIWWLFGFEGASGAIWDGKGSWAEASRILDRSDFPDFLKRIGIAEAGKSLEERSDVLAAKRRDLSWEGALRFFDVIPELEGDSMGVDIKNPHYGDYYQGKSSPHDAGSPVPIFFLVIPPGSRFTFVVDCPQEHRLPEVLRGKWRELVRQAFTYAFDWLGFGAKTAVGYGAMEQRKDTEEVGQHTQVAPVQKRSSWVDEKVKELSSKPGIRSEDVLRAKNLAEAVRAIEDPALKKAVLEDIENRWKEKDWWDVSSGKSAKEARKIYDEIRKEITTQ